MEHKLNLIFIVLLSAICNVHAQRSEITIDSLRIHFQKEEPHIVYDYFNLGNSKIDYQTIYYDQEMKNYLMTWFDTDVWVNYKVLVYTRNYMEVLESKWENKESTVRLYVKYELKLNPDSVCPDTSSINLYFAQAVAQIAQKEKERVLKDKANLIPPWKALYLHAKIAYPEAYKKIKELWYKRNKSAEISSGLFTALLTMNDPEAQAEMDRLVQQFVNSKGQIEEIDILKCLEPVSNAYAIRKLIEILPVKKLVPGLAGSDGTSEVPYDFFVYQQLDRLFIRNDIVINYDITYDVVPNRKNQDRIIASAQELIRKFEEKQEYWMKNMPFDYVPKIENEDTEEK